MPPRAPGVHTHEDWKGMAQPVGLVGVAELDTLGSTTGKPSLRVLRA